MMRSSRNSVIAVLGVVLCAGMLAVDSNARPVQCKILQQKLGRLYFSVGKEEDIWPGCRWMLCRESGDTLKPVREGKIAESYDGVSVTDSLVNLTPDSLSHTLPIVIAADSALGLIAFFSAIDLPEESFMGDTTPEITAPEEMLWPPLDTGFQGVFRKAIYFMLSNASAYQDPREHGVAIFPLDSSASERFSSGAGPEDAYVTYNRADCVLAQTSISTPAPFFVALIPNVSRRVNQNGMLTTAIRYRIDSSRMNAVFEFSSLPQQSFLPGVTSYKTYDSDAGKSKALLKQNRPTGASVSINYHSPTLASSGRFIRGTLAQAGYNTSLISWDIPADLRLLIVPVNTEFPWYSLQTVISALAIDTVAKDKSNQPIRLANQLLTDARQTSDSAQQSRLFQRVDRILMEDIGAFPLFRPIVYVCAKEEIRGIRFDKNGRIDIRNIYRLKLPSDTAGTAP